MGKREAIGLFRDLLCEAGDYGHISEALMYETGYMTIKVQTGAADIEITARITERGAKDGEPV